jgi:hypothetical protein
MVRDRIREKVVEEAPIRDIQFRGGYEVAVNNKPSQWLRVVMGGDEMKWL